MVLYFDGTFMGHEGRGGEGKRLRGHDLTLALHGQFFGGEGSLLGLNLAALRAWGWIFVLNLFDCVVWVGRNDRYPSFFIY
jgi:hypothetical protein